MGNREQRSRVQSGSVTSEAAKPRTSRRKGTAATSGPVQLLRYMMATELIRDACAAAKGGNTLRVPMSLALLHSDPSAGCAAGRDVIGSEEEIVVTMTSDRPRLLTGISKVRLLQEAEVAEAMVVIVAMDEALATTYLRYSQLQSMLSR